MSNQLKIQLRNELKAIESFEDRIKHLEAFCLKYSVKHLWELKFDEWQENSLKNSVHITGQVPLESYNNTDRLQLNQWAVQYYSRLFPMASFEGLKNEYNARVCVSPYPEKYTEQEINDAKQQLTSGNALYGFIQKGYKEVIAAVGFDLTRPIAYEEQLYYELKGRALAHYIPFLENMLKNGIPSKNKKSKDVDKTVNTPQRLLTTYYLQRIGKFPDTTPDKKPFAEFLNFLIGGDERNIRNYLNNIDRYRQDKEYLETVRDKFVRIGLTEAVRLVDEDLSKVPKT